MILSKLTRSDLEYIYHFISEFQEVYAMTKLQYLQEDTIKFYFIMFAIKDNAKKWLHNMPTNSITSWDEFITMFLKEYDPTYKTTKIKNAINHFRQIPRESFCNSWNGFKISQCHVTTIRQISVECVKSCLKV